MAKKGFTPMIGLAVVVALALVAVFGAMSLTPDPAHAGTPTRLTATGAANSVILEFRDQLVGGAATLDTSWAVQYRENKANVAYTGWLKNAAAGHSIAVDDGDTSGELDPTSMVEITVGGLSDGEEYCFRVREQHLDASPSSPTTAICATPNEAPAPAVMELTAARGTVDDKLVGGTVEIKWDTDGSDPDAWQYRITVVDGISSGVNKIGKWIDMVGADGRDEKYTITGLDAEEITIAIRGVAEYDSGDIYSADSAESTPEVTPLPVKPTGVEAKGDDEKVVLSWDALKDENITGYQYRSKSGDDEYADADWEFVTYEDTGTEAADLTAPITVDSADPGAEGVTVSGLDNGTEYTFQVRALAGVIPEVPVLTTAIMGEASAEVTVTPIAPTLAELVEGGIPNPPLLGVGATMDLALSMYFVDGAGTGDIDEYQVLYAEGKIAITGLDTTDEITSDDGNITIIGLSDGITVVTVIARDTNAVGKENVLTTNFTVSVGEEAAEVIPVVLPDPYVPTIEADDLDPAAGAQYTHAVQHWTVSLTVVCTA